MGNRQKNYWWIREFWVVKKEKKVDFLVDLKCYCFFGGFKSEGALVSSKINIRKKHFPWWVGKLWVIKIKLISYTAFLVTIILFIFLIQGEQLLLVCCNLSDQ